MHLFLPKRHFTDFKNRVKRKWKLAIKCSILLGIPIIPTAIVTPLWYLVIFKHGWHFDEKMEGIVTAAWCPFVGILYVLLATMVVNTVWTEYKAIRSAVKRYDFDAFMELRDEEMSPLVYSLVGVTSLFALGTFMSLKYHTWQSGTIIIGSTCYVLALLYIVVKEIDDPCAGLWYIKSIPAAWLKVDPKAWRQRTHEEAHEKFLKKCLELRIDVVTGIVAVTNVTNVSNGSTTTETVRA